MSFCAVHLPRVIEKDLIKSGVRVSQGHVVELFPKPGWEGISVRPWDIPSFKEKHWLFLKQNKICLLAAQSPALQQPERSSALSCLSFLPVALVTSSSVTDQCVLWLVSRVPVSQKVCFVFGIRYFPWNLARDVTYLHTLHLLLAGAELGLAEGQFCFYETENIMLLSAISELECFRGFILQREMF